MPDNDSPSPTAAIARGRGASSNGTGRFEAHARVSVSDDWPGDGEPPPVLRTEFRADASRSVIARNRSPDLPFDRSINPYRGCEHGCIYCFARPTHAYLGLSPGLDFETRILVKPDAPMLLRGELSRPAYRPATIAIGTNTDPYQPAEAALRIMEGILGVLAAFRHPVAIVTKGALVRRDAALLGEMAADDLATVGISLTTLDPDLSRAMEPRAAAPANRLKTIETLARAGVPVRAMVAPVIPGLTDHEMESLLASAADAGAVMASYITLRLPLEVEGLFTEWLQRHRPDRVGRIMGRLRDMHGGKVYDPTFGQRMRGRGVMADLLSRRFAVACTRLGLETGQRQLRTDLFSVPGCGQQLSLF